MMDAEAIDRVEKALAHQVARGCNMALIDAADLRTLLALASRDPEAAKLEEAATNLKFVLDNQRPEYSSMPLTEPYIRDLRLLIDTALGAANTPEQQT
jgi:hypothetical protein